jgi:DNA-binding response OmpR family regulator
MRILLVEDDPEMAAMLHQVLCSAGFAVDMARDGKRGLEKALEGGYRAIVLDLMLPQIDGLRLCAEYRAQRGATPVLMITARDSVMDRVRGLETGADDYLPKPFDVRELLARVRALIRRDRVLRARKIQVGELCLDTRQRTAELGDQPIPLTRVEYGILELLLTQVGRVVFRETLLENVWQDREPGSNKLDVAVRTLRRKLSAVGLGELIQTIYGVGYTVRDDS